MTTLAVVSTAATTIGEIKAAKAQNKAITAQLAEQTAQIESQESAELNDRQRQVRREQARIRIAAGQQGLNTTGSVLSLLQDSAMQGALADERISQNADNQHKAASAEANSMYSRVSQPTILGAGLRIAQAGMGGYYQGKGIQASQRAASKGPALNG